jgi:hypothetical protein
MYAIQQEMEAIPTGGAILAVVLVAVAMLVMIAIGRITLVASQHDPNPPVGVIESPAPQAPATGE